MKNKEWEAIHEVFFDMEDLSRSLSLTPVEEKSVVIEDEIIRVRTEIRAHLEQLRVKLSGDMNERETYLVLFPIVVYFDELIQSNYLRGGLKWPALQKELYSIDDGGVLFYDTLEDILRKPQTLPFVYEVFYFCLCSGFRGRYSEDQVKINEYVRKLTEKIPVREVRIDNSASRWRPPPRLRNIGSPVWYYVGAVAGVSVFYVLLKYWAVYHG